MKLAVVGSRSFKDIIKAQKRGCLIIKETVDRLGITEIVSGGAAGPDQWGETVAEFIGIPTTIYKPDWNTYGKSAGIRRNVDIINDADRVLIFWDGKSTGTAHDIKITRKQNKPYELFIWEKDEKWRLYESNIN